VQWGCRRWRFNGALAVALPLLVALATLWAVYRSRFRGALPRAAPTVAILAGWAASQ
jgi:hypothetical protein